MNQTDTLFGLDDFARNYASGIRHYDEVRTEHLAEAVRSFFDLPPFPTQADLSRLCSRLGIPVGRLPPTVPMDGVNFDANGRAEILVRDDLHIRRLETTLCHEIREVIERAFKRVHPGYVALDTANNKLMNRESDHFGGCLLMQADASRSLLREVGFDLLRFSQRTGRSLPSVVVRLQSLYSVATGEKIPHAGIYLFEAPWPSVQSGAVDIPSMTVAHCAQLCGFSRKKHGSQAAKLVREWFPARGSQLIDFGLGLLSLQDREPMMECLEGFDMFREHDFTVVVEPLFRRNVPWRVLYVAARNDCMDILEPWLDRLAIRSVFHMRTGLPAISV